MNLEWFLENNFVNRNYSVHCLLIHDKQIATFHTFVCGFKLNFFYNRSKDAKYNTRSKKLAFMKNS